MSEKPTVVEALSAVMADVQAVHKDSKHDAPGAKFNFRGVDAVMNAVGPAFRNHEVVCLPVAEDARYEVYDSKSGGRMRSCTLRVRFRFVGPAGDALECVTYGEASDSSDKSTAKAHSVAYRTALLQALCIPTDEPDPDDSQYHHERAATPAQAPQATDEQVVEFAELLKEMDAAEKEVLRVYFHDQSIPRIAQASKDQAAAGIAEARRVIAARHEVAES